MMSLTRTARLTMTAACLALVGACSTISVPGGPDLINNPPGEPPRAPTAPRPEPDARGVISYPNYQVAVARPGDTVQTIAGRLGLDSAALASTNGLPADASLNNGELVLLPTRVAAAPSGSSAITPGGSVDVSALAGSALDRADGKTTAPAPSSSAIIRANPVGVEPSRHTVARGETAYSIARSYNVSVKALGEWNGLDSALTVREGQVLLIPVATGPAPTAADVAAPGVGSTIAEPPSAALPQPDEEIAPAAEAAKPKPVATTELSDKRTSASDTTQLAQPVSGRIIRGYSPGKNEGLDFGAAPGAAVTAADAGTVAAITRDVDQVPIIVLRHDDNLLTVYANVDGIAVKKGDTVSRGQTLAKVRSAEPSYLHFEVRNGFDSVDPVPYLSN